MVYAQKIQELETYLSTQEILIYNLVPTFSFFIKKAVSDKNEADFYILENIIMIIKKKTLFKVAFILLGIISLFAFTPIVFNISGDHPEKQLMWYAYFFFFAITMLILFVIDSRLYLEFIIYFLGSIIIFDQIIRIIEGYEVATLPRFIFELLGVLSAYLIRKSLIKGILFLISCVIMIILFQNYFWLSYQHYSTYKNYDGVIAEKISNRLIIANHINDYDYNKYTVLDFWFSRCRPCLKTFPKLDSLFRNNLSNQELRILSINLPIEKDTNGEALNLIEGNGYKFPLLISKELPILFKIETYPTVIVLHHDSVIYRGDLEFSIKFLSNKNVLSK